MSSWMIYGAYGYTGRLIATEALKRGHRPILAGRSRAPLAEMAGDLGLPYRAFSLDDPGAVAEALYGHAVVLHCAGPFVHTSAPMVAGCMATGCHYVDITGEIPVFQQIFAQDAEARERGIGLVSGGGFDVVPTDCLAKHVAERLPTATHLELHIAGGERTSAGTAKSIVEQLPHGGLVRTHGRLVEHPLGQGGKTVRFADGVERRLIPIPWGDLETAWHSTGIDHIATYMASPPGAETALKLFGAPLRRALGSEKIRNLVQKVAGDFARPPDAEERRAGRSHFHAVARDESGNAVESWLEAPEAYALTAMTAVRIVERLLAEKKQGSLTPAMAFGADFILEFPGVRRFDALP